MLSNLKRKDIFFWYISLVVLTLFMVFVGGLTRLTNSGLSMVDWRPIMGAIPPISSDDWSFVFERYKQFPEFKIVNYSMTIGEFKQIFYLEYFHRLVGRMFAPLVLIPWVIFNLKKTLSRADNLKVFGVFLLGCCQGLMGWYMVKSGLVHDASVSHYRLAAHLGLAIIIMGLFFLMSLEELKVEKSLVKNNKLLLHLATCFVILVFVQIIFGAFMAGKHAGLGYNTFPKMGPTWIPSIIYKDGLYSFFANLTSVKAHIQLVHRLLAMGIVSLCSYMCFSIRKLQLNQFQKACFKASLAFVFIQFLLGVITLTSYVPTYLASIHQIFACFLFLSTILTRFSTTRTNY